MALANDGGLERLLGHQVNGMGAVDNGDGTITTTWNGFRFRHGICPDCGTTVVECEPFCSGCMKKIPEKAFQPIPDGLAEFDTSTGEAKKAKASSTDDEFTDEHLWSSLDLEEEVRSGASGGGGETGPDGPA